MSGFASKKNTCDGAIYKFFEERAIYKNWLRIEVAVANVQKDSTEVPQDAVEEIVELAQYEDAVIGTMLEQSTGKSKQEMYTVFLNYMKSLLSKDNRMYLQYGVTNAQVIETSRHLVMKDVDIYMLDQLGDMIEEVITLIKYMQGKARTYPQSYGSRAATKLCFRMTEWLSELLKIDMHMENYVEHVLSCAAGYTAPCWGTPVFFDPAHQAELAEMIGLPGAYAQEMQYTMEHTGFKMVLMQLNGFCDKMAKNILEGLEECLQLTNSSDTAIVEALIREGLNMRAQADAIYRLNASVQKVEEEHMDNEAPFEQSICGELLNASVKLLQDATVFLGNMHKKLPRLVMEHDKFANITFGELVNLQLCDAMGEEKGDIVMIEMILGSATKEELKESIQNNKEISAFCTANEIAKLLSEHDSVSKVLELADSYIKRGLHAVAGIRTLTN